MEINHSDVVILGSGPAGLQAAIHAARKKVSVLVVGKELKSSLYHAHIENYAFIFKATGEEMLTVGVEQAKNFGAEFLEEDILHIAGDEDGFRLTTESGHIIHCHAFVIATGTSRNKLGVPGEKELFGKGVSYCVDCDGNFYKGEDVAVVGGESAAVDGALTMTRLANQVHLVYDTLRVSDVLARKLSESSILVHEGATVRAVKGENKVTHLLLSDESEIPVSGVFVELGAKGLMELSASLGIRLDDDMKYIDTNKKQETNIPGIYAAGDICGPPWQLAKAVGEGCVAGIEAAVYAKNRGSQPS